jgi:hypothetical protein
MSNRYLKQFSYTFEQDVCSLFATLVVGASGAVTQAKGGGIASIVKEATAGQYTIELEDKWNQLLMVQAVIVDDAISSAIQFQIFEDPSLLQSDLKADKKFKVQFFDEAAAAINLTSGAQVKFEIKVRRSGVAPFDI